MHFKSPGAARILTVLAAILLIACVPACDNVEEEIQLTLAELDEAARRRDGETFARGLAPESFLHMDRLIKLALDGTYEQVVNLPIEERADVLMMRNRSTRKELSKMDGRAWLVHVVKQGWVEGVLPPSELVERQEVRAGGSSATLEIIYDVRQPLFSGEGSGKRLSDTIAFQRVDERWLVDVRRPSVLFSKYIEWERRTSHRSPNQILEDLEEAETGKEVTRMIWEEKMR